MQERHDPYRYERYGVRFLRALRDGDAGRLAEVWQAALDDPDLDALFADLLAHLNDPTTPGAASAGPSSPESMMPPVPELIVHHHTSDTESHPDAGAYKKSR